MSENVSERSVRSLLDLWENKASENKDITHLFVHCADKSIVERFLEDAKAEGFSANGDIPVEADLFSINSDRTFTASQWAGHVMAKNGTNSICVEYHAYISGEDTFIRQ